MQTTIGNIPTLFSESPHSEEIHSIEINSARQWLSFIRNIRNGLYVITHDHAIWHRSIPSTPKSPPHIQCDLQSRIRRRLKSWGDSQCYLYHSDEGELWVTVRVPDHFCLECDRRTKPHQEYCHSCNLKVLYWNRPFFDNYQERSFNITTASLERGYRMITGLRSKEKLALIHDDCTTPAKCLHMRLYIKKFGNRALYESKVIKNVSYYVRKIDGFNNLN